MKELSTLHIYYIYIYTACRSRAFSDFPQPIQVYIYIKCVLQNDVYIHTKLCVYIYIHTEWYIIKVFLIFNGHILLLTFGAMGQFFSIAFSLLFS